MRANSLSRDLLVPPPARPPPELEARGLPNPPLIPYPLPPRIPPLKGGLEGEGDYPKDAPSPG